MGIESMNYKELVLQVYHDAQCSLWPDSTKDSPRWYIHVDKDKRRNTVFLRNTTYLSTPNSRNQDIAWEKAWDTVQDNLLITLSK
jgi:hypothetical protein